MLKFSSQVFFLIALTLTLLLAGCSGHTDTPVEDLADVPPASVGSGIPSFEENKDYYAKTPVTVALREESHVYSDSDDTYKAPSQRLDAALAVAEDSLRTWHVSVNIFGESRGAPARPYSAGDTLELGSPIPVYSYGSDGTIEDKDEAYYPIYFDEALIGMLYLRGVSYYPEGLPPDEATPGDVPAIDEPALLEAGYCAGGNIATEFNDEILPLLREGCAIVRDGVVLYGITRNETKLVYCPSPLDGKEAESLSETLGNLARGVVAFSA